MHCMYFDTPVCTSTNWWSQPVALRGKYQCYTQADLTALRATGCDHQFVDVQTGVSKYIQCMAAQV